MVWRETRAEKEVFLDRAALWHEVVERRGVLNATVSKSSGGQKLTKPDIVLKSISGRKRKGMGRGVEEKRDTAPQNGSTRKKKMREINVSPLLTPIISLHVFDRTRFQTHIHTEKKKRGALQHVCHAAPFNAGSSVTCTMRFCFPSFS
jgi:hypothetical protein